MQFTRRAMIGGGVALTAAGLPFGRALAAGRPPFVNRIQLENGRVMIAALVEGKGPFLFVIDTGSGLSFIEDSFAKKQGLEKRPGQRRFGIGGGVSDYSWYAAKEVRLASGIRFNDMQFAGTRDGLLGQDLIGGFGSGMFTSYDTDLDFVKGEWRAYTDGRPDFAGMTRVKSRFNKSDHAPKVIADATIDGFEGDYIVDTGFSRAISLSGRDAAKSGLWNDSRPYAPTEARGFGAKGIPGRLVRGTRLRFGEHDIDQPLISLNAPGTQSSDYGLIGLDILSRFHLSTRVSDGSLWVAPNGTNPRPFGYRLSGIWLDEDKGGRVTVTDVGTGSPASIAGVKKGDVVKGGDMATLTRATNGQPGKQVALEIERGGAAQTIRYTLAPWL